MTTFLALYRRATVGDAKFVSMLANPSGEAYVASRLLETSFDGLSNSDDAVLGSARRKNALNLIASNAHNNSVYNRTKGDAG